jgi:hypothetical protein
VRKHDDSLRELYHRTCTVDGVEAMPRQAGAESAAGRCSRSSETPSRLPCRVSSIPEAALQKQFYERLERRRKEREQAAAEAGRKKDVTLLPGASLATHRAGLEPNR